MMALQENDGTYQIKNAHQEGNVLWRLYCGSKNCPIIAKFVRKDGSGTKLCMYSHELETPSNGLKQLGMPFVMDNPHMLQKNILLEELNRNKLSNSLC
jgi:hypothetical protein